MCARTRRRARDWLGWMHSLQVDVSLSALLDRESKMTADMISISRCIALSGLATDEALLGVTPVKRHADLRQSYMFRVGDGRAAMRERMIRDIRASLDLGATRLAADLFVVLRMTLAEELKKPRQRRRRNAACAAPREFPRRAAPATATAPTKRIGRN